MIELKRLVILTFVIFISFYGFSSKKINFYYNLTNIDEYRYDIITGFEKGFKENPNYEINKIKQTDYDEKTVLKYFSALSEGADYLAYIRAGKAETIFVTINIYKNPNYSLFRTGNDFYTIFNTIEWTEDVAKTLIFYDGNYKYRVAFASDMAVAFSDISFYPAVHGKFGYSVNETSDLFIDTGFYTGTLNENNSMSLSSNAFFISSGILIKQPIYSIGLGLEFTDIKYIFMNFIFNYRLYTWQFFDFEFSSQLKLSAQNFKPMLTAGLTVNFNIY